MAELNPSGKVPVLIVDDTAISDSVAIMTFLADRHGDLTYAAGTIERAKQDSLTQMINDEQMRYYGQQPATVSFFHQTAGCRKSRTP